MLTGNREAEIRVHAVTCVEMEWRPHLVVGAARSSGPQIEVLGSGRF
jgi:hypothetical protein